MSNNNASYKQAIDILMADKTDYKALAINLAKSYPSIFVRMAESQTEPVETWHGVVNDRIRGGQKVEAIKEIRTNTGLGLKEAKDIADNVQNMLISNGRSFGAMYEGAAGLTAENVAIARQIAKARG